MSKIEDDELQDLLIARLGAEALNKHSLTGYSGGETPRTAALVRAR